MPVSYKIKGFNDTKTKFHEVSPKNRWKREIRQKLGILRANSKKVPVFCRRGTFHREIFKTTGLRLWMLNLGYNGTFNTSVRILKILTNIYMDGPASMRIKRYSYQQLTRLINQNNHIPFPILLLIIVLSLGLLGLLEQTQSGRPTNWNPIDHKPTNSKPLVGPVSLPITLHLNT